MRILCTACRKKAITLAKGYALLKAGGIDIEAIPNWEEWGNPRADCRCRLVYEPNGPFVYGYQDDGNDCKAYPEDFEDYHIDDYAPHQPRCPDMNKLYQLTEGRPFNPAELALSAAKRKKIQPFLDRVIRDSEGIHILQEISFYISKEGETYQITKLQRGRAATEVTLAVSA